MMRLFGVTKFCVKGLNQSRWLDKLSKEITLKKVVLKDRNITDLQCAFFDKKYVFEFLKKNELEILSVADFGFLPKILHFFCNLGYFFAIFVFLTLFFLQNQFIFCVEINGLETLSKREIVDTIQNSFSMKKCDLNVDEIEVLLIEKFEKISLVSCAIRGQTLIVNVKEKVNPKQMSKNFSPIIADKNGKITEINLISGTLAVNVGDYVKKGDVLVFPYSIDSSGEQITVEANANFVAEVYSQGHYIHFDSRVETCRTGEVQTRQDVKLFGKVFYSLVCGENFENYEEEIEEKKLSENNILPIKYTKTIRYQLTSRVVEESFESVQEDCIEKARKNALKICQNCDTIKEEFYSIRRYEDKGIVDYCVTTIENIGVYDAS